MQDQKSYYFQKWMYDQKYCVATFFWWGEAGDSICHTDQVTEYQYYSFISNPDLFAQTSNQGVSLNVLFSLTRTSVSPAGVITRIIYLGFPSSCPVALSLPIQTYVLFFLNFTSKLLKHHLLLFIPVQSFLHICALRLITEFS